MGNGNPDLWQSTAVFNNQSTASHMYVAYNSTGNTFNGDVTFNNQPGATGLWIYPNYYGLNTQFNGNIFVTNVNGAGVYFGANTGTATLAGSGSVSVGAAGFNSGGLIFRNFTQTNASAAQNITTTGTSYIQYGSAVSFAASVTSSSPGLLFNGSTFNGIVNCTKTGASNDQSQGGNTFNAAATFTNNGTGYLLMTNNSSDAYNSNTSFVMNATGAVYPNYNNSSNYTGNLTVTAASAITFGAGATGTATFSGAANQNINATAGTPAPIFTRLVINNTGSGVTLNNTPINVSNSLSLATGLLNTSTAYILTMLNGSTTAAGTALSTSYVNGPMAYQKSTPGVSTLNFPIGNGPDCRPFILTVNHSTGTLYSYTAMLYDANAALLGYTLPPSVTRVSGMHYYTIARTNAAGASQPFQGLSGNQTIQIFFGANDYVTDGSTLTIVKNTYTATTAWIDIGGTGGPAASGGADLTGSIISTSGPTAFNSFSTFAIANKIGGTNVLPIKLLYFTARPDNSKVDLGWGTATESNNNYFTIERSHDGIIFDSLMRVNSLAFDGTSSTPLDYTAVDPSPLQGTSFYRLKQTDLDGNTQYSTVESVYFGQQTTVSIYPNPSAGTLYVSGLPGDQTTLKAEWYDIGGRLVLQQMVSVQGGIAMLNTHFTNGVYVLKFQSADGTIMAKNVLIMR
jgi:Secretion system C-terminal sorting domain